MWSAPSLGWRPATGGPGGVLPAGAEDLKARLLAPGQRGTTEAELEIGGLPLEDEVWRVVPEKEWGPHIRPQGRRGERRDRDPARDRVPDHRYRALDGSRAGPSGRAGAVEARIADNPLRRGSVEPHPAGDQRGLFWMHPR